MLDLLALNEQGKAPPGWSRREFITALGALVAAGAPGIPELSAGEKAATSPRRYRGRIALLATEVRKYSHAQHFIDRFLEGYGWQGRHHLPELELVSLYVDQFPDRDLTHDRVKRHGVRLYSNIADALTLGGEELAVDGVVIIAEHGDYPRNRKGQKLYPRYDFFRQCVEVFERSGRSVPVFNDKHLSTDWNECAAMMDDCRRLEIPFFAGSSLPVTWRMPSLEMPRGAALTKSLCACYGGVDSYDFHGFETAQSMAERRGEGEVGVKSVHALRGEAAWKELRRREGFPELLLSAVSRSITARAPRGHTYSPLDLDWFQQASPGAVIVFAEHLDGHETAMLLLNGLLLDFNYAGFLGDTGQVLSCQFHLPMPPRYTTLADFFNPLVHQIERLILEKRAPIPPERTLLTSGLTLFGVESLYRGQVRLETPELAVAYPAPVESTFWRA